MPYVDSRVVLSAISPGSSTVTSLATSSITLPSLVDAAILLVIAKGNPTTTPVWNTSESFQFMSEQRNVTTDITTRIYLLRRPTPTTATFAVTFGTASYCGIGVLGLIDTIPSYSALVGYTQIVGTTVSGTAISTNITSVSTDLVVDVLGDNPAYTPFVGADQTEHFNLQINSGGGANALGFHVSSETATGTTTTMSWQEPFIATGAHLMISLKDASQTLAGQGRIIRTP